MSPFSLKRPGQPEPLSETAASWVLKAEEGAMSTVEVERLRHWLSEPSHAQAFDDALWALDAVQRHSASAELMAMRESALARRAEPWDGRTAWIAGLGGAALAASLAGLLWIGQPTERTGAPASEAGAVAGASLSQASANDGTYRTGIGERSAVMLPDGSVATLDTDSELKIAYTASERGIYLTRGQALFEVAKGKPLPFQVYAAGQRITAVGTTFDVRIKGSEVRVSMIEGVVKVRPALVPEKPGQPLRELTLRAGESLVTAASAAVIVQPIDTAEVATWRGGLLVFDDEKLSDAVGEINRYTERPIRIADASIGDYRVTGVFKTNDPDHFATAMSEVFPIEVKRDSAGAPVLVAK
jgi:transmembrane sensor